MSSESRTSRTRSSAVADEVIRLSPGTLESAREVIEEMLDPAWDYGDPIDLADPVGEALEGNVQVWACVRERIDAVIVTRLVRGPHRGELILRGEAAGGRNLEGWLPRAVEVLEEYAREKGADYTELTGRRGWLRQLRGYGYDEVRVTVQKEVNHVRRRRRWQRHPED